MTNTTMPIATIPTIASHILLGLVDLFFFIVSPKSKGSPKQISEPRLLILLLCSSIIESNHFESMTLSLTLLPTMKYGGLLQFRPDRDFSSRRACADTEALHGC